MKGIGSTLKSSIGGLDKRAHFSHPKERKKQSG